MSEWRDDMENAPKEYPARILAADADGWVGEVYWYDRYSEYMGDGPGWMVANADSEYGWIVDATHWMPLPQPPIASAGDFKQNQGPT